MRLLKQFKAQDEFEQSGEKREREVKIGEGGRECVTMW